MQDNVGYSGYICRTPINVANVYYLIFSIAHYVINYLQLKVATAHTTAAELQGIVIKIKAVLHIRVLKS